jgi:hypothetical protein
MDSGTESFGPIININVSRAADSAQLSWGPTQSHVLGGHNRTLKQSSNHTQSARSNSVDRVWVVSGSPWTLIALV